MRNITRIAASAMVIAISILAIVVNVRQESAERSKAGPGGIHPEMFSFSKSRFEPLRRMLPARGIVGYIGYNGKEPRHTKTYFLTQYAVAPVILEQSDTHPIVVGNFPGSLPRTDRFLPPGYVINADLGHGVYLLRNLYRKDGR